METVSYSEAREHLASMIEQVVSTREGVMLLKVSRMNGQPPLPVNTARAFLIQGHDLAIQNR